MALQTRGDAADGAAHQYLYAGQLDGAGKRAGEPLRTALHVTATGQEIASLRDREEDPPQGRGVVVIIGEIGGQRAFDGFVVAEDPVQLLRQRQAPVAEPG